MIADLLEQHVAYIYFIYGLSFFALGLALSIESRRSSRLRLARSVWLLAVFGLLHSFHEFGEMFAVVERRSPGLFEEAFQTGLLAISFLPLLAFGIELLPRAESYPSFSARMTVLALIGFLTQAALIRTTYQPSLVEWIRATHVVARYTLGMPAAVLAALGLMRQRRILQEKDMGKFGNDLIIAAVALTWYGVVGQSFPHQSIVFPSMFINDQTFRIWFGFPIQLLRAIMAVIVAIAMIRALRAFEEENRRRLASASNAEYELKLAARELSLLYETSQLLTTAHGLEELIQAAIDRIVQLVEPVKRGIIVVPRPEQEGADVYASCGYTGDTDRVRLRDLTHNGEEMVWLDRDRQNVTLQITDSIPQLQAIDILEVTLMLKTRQGVLGTVLLETQPEGPYLSSLEAPTILALARQLAIAIENARLVLRLRQREAQRGELFQRTTTAQEAERKRIARELHDETGQALTALAVGLKGVRKQFEQNPRIATEQFEELQVISTHALEELRHLISDLRPSQLDDLGLVPALRWYAEMISRRSGIKVSLTVTGEAQRLLPELETTVFRIVQEGLNNVVKHSGAQQAWLRLEFHQDALRLTIIDDGHGFDRAAIMEPGAGRAWGLIGIQERATLAGGKAYIESAPGHGTTLDISLPAAPPDSVELVVEGASYA